MQTSLLDLPSVSKTVTILVPASKEAVFDFLSNIENLPAWATESCQGLKREGTHHKVVTSMGELFFRIESDQKSGVLDMFAGPTLTEQGIFPCRVIAMPNGTTAITFTFFRSPDMPVEIYERQCQPLVVEMQGLAQRFSAVGRTRCGEYGRRSRRRLLAYVFVRFWSLGSNPATFLKAATASRPHLRDPRQNHQHREEHFRHRRD